MVQEDEEHLLVGTAGYGLYRLNIKTLKSEKLEGYAQIDKDYYSHIFLDSEGLSGKQVMAAVLNAVCLRERFSRLSRPMARSRVLQNTKAVY